MRGLRPILCTIAVVLTLLSAHSSVWSHTEESPTGSGMHRLVVHQICPDNNGLNLRGHTTENPSAVEAFLEAGAVFQCARTREIDVVRYSPSPDYPSHLVYTLTTASGL